MAYFLAIGLGYLLGCSNMAYWLSRIKNVDIRKNGSGNLGASNATVLLGWGAGVIVALHDIGKAVLAVILTKLLFPEAEYAAAAAGVACVLGHIFPFYLKFKGGKGPTTISPSPSCPWRYWQESAPSFAGMPSWVPGRSWTKTY